MYTYEDLIYVMADIDINDVGDNVQFVHTIDYPTYWLSWHLYRHNRLSLSTYFYLLHVLEQVLID